MTERSISSDRPIRSIQGSICEWISDDGIRANADESSSNASEKEPIRVDETDLFALVSCNFRGGRKGPIK